MRCGYCGGQAYEVNGQWRHATTRWVAGRHHYKGSVVLTRDLKEDKTA